MYTDYELNQISEADQKKQDDKIATMRNAKGLLRNAKWELETAQSEVIDELFPELRTAPRNTLLALREVLPELIRRATWRERNERNKLISY